ncbi:MAG TPA: single-stranded DNA-binding protein [Urbifossiella sp.]|jgi:single-strand DNA-binding protein
MATLNKIMLMGRLTRDPQDAALPTGTRVVKFGFAVGRSKKNPQTGQWENDPNPLFIDCEAFARPDARRDLVSLIQQYCRKGDQLYIEGRLQLDQWDDKQTGQKRSKHKIVVENIEFLGSKQGDGGGGMGGGGMGGGRPMGNRGGGSNYGPPPDDHGPDGPDYGAPPPSVGGGEDIPF